jgi:hypothetical protein
VAISCRVESARPTALGDEVPRRVDVAVGPSFRGAHKPFSFFPTHNPSCLSSHVSLLTKSIDGAPRARSQPCQPLSWVSNHQICCISGELTKESNYRGGSGLGSIRSCDSLLCLFFAVWLCVCSPRLELRHPPLLLS